MTTRLIGKLLLTCSFVALLDPNISQAADYSRRMSVETTDKHSRHVSSNECEGGSHKLGFDCTSIKLTIPIPGLVISESQYSSNVEVTLPKSEAQATGILTLQLIRGSLLLDYKANMAPLQIYASSSESTFNLFLHRGMYSLRSCSYLLESPVRAFQPHCDVDIKVPTNFSVTTEFQSDSTHANAPAATSIPSSPLSLMAPREINWESLQADRQVIAHMYGITTQEVDSQISWANKNKSTMNSALDKLNARSFDDNGKTKIVWGVNSMPAVVVTFSEINTNNPGCAILFPSNFKKKRVYQNVSVALTTAFHNTENFNTLVPYVLGELAKMYPHNNLYIALCAEMTREIAKKGGFEIVKGRDGEDHRFEFSNPYPKAYSFTQNCGSAIHHADRR